MSTDDDSSVSEQEKRAQEVVDRLAAAKANPEVLQDKGMDRRDFLGASMATLAGATVGGFVGFGTGLFGFSIGHSDGESPVQAVTTTTEGQAVAPPTTAAGVEIPAAGELVFYPRAKIASLSDLQEGVPLSFDYPLAGQNSELVKLGNPAKFGLGDDADIVAFSTKCTHMGWPLGGTFKKELCIWGPCPGHLSTFDACTGGQSPLGQASQNLPQVVLAIDGDDIYAEGVLGLIYGYRDNLRDGVAVEVSL